MEGGGRLSNSTNSIQTILLPSNKLKSSNAFAFPNLSSNGSKSYMDISHFSKKTNSKKAPEVRISLSDFNFGKDAGPEKKNSGFDYATLENKRDSSESGGFGNDEVHVIAVDEEKLIRKEEDIIELWKKWHKVNTNIIAFMQEKDFIMKDIVETKSAVNEIKLRTMEHKLFQKLSAKFHKNPPSFVPQNVYSGTPTKNTPTKNMPAPAQIKPVTPAPNKPVAMAQTKQSAKNQTPVQLIRNRTRKYRLVSSTSQDDSFDTNDVQKKSSSVENVWTGGHPDVRQGMENEAKSYSTDNIWCGIVSDPKHGVLPEPIYGVVSESKNSGNYGVVNMVSDPLSSDPSYGRDVATKPTIAPKPISVPQKEPVYAVSKKVLESAEKRKSMDIVQDNSNFTIVGDKILRQAFNKRSFQVFEEDYTGLEQKPIDPIDQQQTFKRNRRSRRSSIHYNKEEFEYIKAVLDKESTENSVEDEPIYETVSPGPIYENVVRKETKAFLEAVNLEEEVEFNSNRPVSANSQVFKCRMDPQCQFEDTDQQKLKSHVTSVHLESRKSFEHSQENLLKKGSDSSDDNYPTIKFDGGSLTSLTGNVGSIADDDDDDVFETDPISLREIQQDQKSPPERQVASVNSMDSGKSSMDPVSCNSPNPELFKCRMDPECTYSGRNIEKHIATVHQKHLAELMKMAQKKK